MATFERGTGEFAGKVCEALGIDPKKTRRLTLNLDVADIVSVEVEQYVDVDAAGDLVYELQRYALVEREEPEENADADVA